MFLGPSLPIDEARRIVPDAIFLPPARQADLLSAVINLQPQVVGLIDGVFLNTASVWHKEILRALEWGVHVLGASSMGALRAAETACYGMVGIGEVYHSYACGELMDDDEVALTHGPEEDGYRKFSEPMVNVRATLAAAQAAHVIDAKDASLVIEVAKSMHFSTRLWREIFETAMTQGLSAEVSDRLAKFVSTSYVDLKARDAILLLEAIRDLPETLGPFHAEHRTGLNAGLETMYNRDRNVQIGGVLVPLADIAEHVALHDPDFHTLNFNALNRAIAVAFARILQIDPGAGEVAEEERRFRQRNSVEDDEALRMWLVRNNQTTADFAMMMKESAMCRAVHKWLIFARFTERTTRLVLDQLRWENRYEEWAVRAAGHQRFLNRAGLSGLLGTMSAPTEYLAADHQHSTGVRFDTAPLVWAEEAGFNNKADFKLSLMRASLARRAVLTLLEEVVDDKSAAFEDTTEVNATEGAG